MARTKEKIELPKKDQLEALADAMLEARTVIRNLERILETVNLSHLGMHEIALLRTLQMDARRFMERYYDHESAF